MCITFNCTFSDINECLEGSDNCDQVCSNTDGSYTCSCNPGFTLDSNRRTCTAVEPTESTVEPTEPTEPEGICEDGYSIYSLRCFQDAVPCLV